MSKLKNSTQRFNNRLDRGKEKEKRINELEERSVESIQLEEQKENEKNIESSGNYAKQRKTVKENQISIVKGFPSAASGKESNCQSRRRRR